MGGVARVALAVCVVAALAACVSSRAAAARNLERSVRVWKIHYRAHDGARRNAYVLLPRWYGPRENPPIPLIISPHGRGLAGRNNVAIWGNLPALGRFAVVNPDGQGRIFRAYSWGAPGQIDDLARMPAIVTRTLPWLRLDYRRIYAFGGSMGGQETLLLIARHPRLLAGAAVFDAVTDFPLQYHDFRRLGCDKGCVRMWAGAIGTALQKMAREEVGGPPASARYGWQLRNPIRYARAIADSCVPLQLWWSAKDTIVIDQQRQSARLYKLIRRLNPTAPVTAYHGYWRHSAEMRARTRLPLALATFGLLPEEYEQPEVARALHVEPAP